MPYTVTSNSPFIVVPPASEAAGTGQHFNFDPTPRVTTPVTSAR